MGGVPVVLNIISGHGRVTDPAKWTNQRPVFRSRDLSGPKSDQYLGHMVKFKKIVNSMMETECRVLCGSPVVDNGIYRHGDAVPAENFLKRNIHES